MADLPDDPVTTDSLCAQIEQINRTATSLITGLQAERDKMRIALRAIYVGTDVGALYENLALHHAAGEGLGYEGHSEDD